MEAWMSMNSIHTKTHMERWPLQFNRAGISAFDFHSQHFSPINFPVNIDKSLFLSLCPFILLASSTDFQSHRYNHLLSDVCTYAVAE